MLQLNLTQQDLNSLTNEDRVNLNQTMSIAYFNLATEYEFTYQLEKATETYIKARHFAAVINSGFTAHIN